MNVVYASNDSYARHLGVSLYSLLENNQTTPFIKVYVLSMGLTKDTICRLSEIAETFGRELILVELGDLKTRFSYEVDTGGFDLSIMARLFLADVLPADMKRVLYMDCDTVVLSSLEKLLRTNLNGKILGAVMEPTIYSCVKDQIGLSKEVPYFNSGVLLIDMDRWRKEKVQQKLLDFYQKKGGKLFAGDQDTINGSLSGEIESISPRYNFFTNYRYFHYRHLIRLSPAYEIYSKKEYSNARRHPVILHYMGDERPWKQGNYNHYRKAYERYLNKTSWAGTKKEKGSRLYLLSYHLMNYLTFLCPPIRDFISRRFGMKVIEFRKSS
ncbi:glycosyltransferase family 8 protein [Clostridium sp. E02]|uniref:glycosyltransferase family 8 protein n=1 Tax=Clostridium sp. E02 TaxID=2487134 RepID=UPI000F51F283|nr:glycosyltransferase family 8 protein [Clostridium sp. E02]